MSELNKAWTINGYRVDPATGKVVIVEYELELTDPVRFPGVVSRHGGVVPVFADIDAEGVTVEQLQAYVEGSLSSDEHFTFHHTNALGWEYDMKRAVTKTDLRSPEAIRASMPSLTQRQMGLMLIQLGMSEAHITGQISQIADERERKEAMVEWTKANSYLRNHPLVVKLGVDLGFTPEELDTMWQYAADNY